LKQVRATRCLVVPLALALLSGGCAQNGGQVSEGGSAGIGAVIGGILGGIIDDDHRARGAAIGGAIGAGLGYAFAKSYNASQRQRQQAEAAGRQFADNPKNASRLEKTETRYVAVPVESEKKSGAKDVVLYDTETGEADDEAYQPEAGSSFESGDVVEVGGKQAMVANSFQGI
jgi:hypothetical protein